MRKAIPKSIRKIVYKKYNGHCAYCGCEIPEKGFNIDHLHCLKHYEYEEEFTGIDVHDISNLMPSCGSCNRYKATMELEDFRKQLQKIPDRIGRSEPTGTTYITRFGNTRHQNVFKEYYKTDMGEFASEKWLEVTLQIIQTLMENELLEEIKEHVAGHCVWLKNDKEIEEYSASCLASGAYMYWEDFKDKRLPAHKVFIFEGGDF